MTKIMPEMLLFMSSTLNQERNATMMGEQTGKKKEDLRIWKFQLRSRNKHYELENMRFESGCVAVE